MIRRAPALAALLTALVLPSGAALAQEYEDPEQTLEKSLYLQLGGNANFDVFGDDASGSNSGGVNIHVGLRTATWMSVEAQFEWVHGMYPDGNKSGDDWTTTFNWRVYPFTDRILKARVQPFLLAGIGVSSYKVNLNGCLGNFCPDSREFGFSSRWGGGVDVYITDSIGVVLDVSYVWVTGTPVRDLNYVSLGLGAIFRFY
jgi:hypothetical protein